MKELTLGKRQKNITLAAALAVAGGLYVLISLVNHYLFKTYGLDLGLYTHAMYDYAHFRVDDCSMFKEVPQSILAAHFDLYLLILSPLVYLFGTYTLLLVQIAAALFGGYGMYKLISLYTDDDWMPLLAMVAFFVSFGIIHPFSYDYHSNVVSAMMLPWLVYSLKTKRYAWATVFVVLLVIGKENMSLWLFFIALGLMWDFRKDKKALWHLLGYALFAVVYFVVVNMLVLPRMGARGIMRYEYLGDNYWAIAKTLILNSGETLRILFTNTSTLHRFDGVKAEFYFCALASGMIFTVLKPNYLLMLMPLLAQKMLAADGMLWGVTCQYSVEFVPVLIISSFLVILRIKKLLWRRILSWTLLVSIVLTTFYTIGTPRAFLFVDQVCVYQGRHYEQRKFDADFARQLIKQIPDDASVSAASMFVPHLALRDQIYDLDSRPNPNADYVLITQPYFDKVVYWKRVFPDHENYETVATDSTIYLLRRIAP